MAYEGMCCSPAPVPATLESFPPPEKKRSNKIVEVRLESWKSVVEDE